MLEQKTHSRLGASHSKRWLNCPGSVQLSEQIPPSPETIYAAEGTVAHKIAEHFLHNGVLTVCAKDHPLCGTVQEQGDFKVKVTPEMVEGANLYAETIFKDMVENGLLDIRYLRDARVTSSHPAVKPFLNIEKQFCIASIDKELFGTNDASVLVPFKKLTVYDYKYGAGIAVNPDHNEQLMFYALGVAEEYGGVDEVCVEEIELVIVQPRATHNDGHVRRWSCAPDILKMYAERLRNGVQATRVSNPEYKAGKWCRFCPAKRICGAVRDEINATAQMDFAPVASPQYGVSPKRVADLTTDELSNILSKLPMVEDWIKEIKEHSLGMLMRGEKIPGYKCVQKRANRAWICEQTVADEFSIMYGNEIWTERKLKSPAQLEKIVGKDAVKDFVTIPDGGYTVAKDSDKRPECVPAVNDFTVMEM